MQYNGSSSGHRPESRHDVEHGKEMKRQSSGIDNPASDKNVTPHAAGRRTPNGNTPSGYPPQHRVHTNAGYSHYQCDPSRPAVPSNPPRPQPLHHAGFWAPAPMQPTSLPYPTTSQPAYYPPPLYGVFIPQPMGFAIPQCGYHRVPVPVPCAQCSPGVPLGPHMYTYPPQMASHPLVSTLGKRGCPEDQLPEGRSPQCPESSGRGAKKEGFVRQRRNYTSDEHSCDDGYGDDDCGGYGEGGSIGDSGGNSTNVGDGYGEGGDVDEVEGENDYVGEGEGVGEGVGNVDESEMPDDAEGDGYGSAGMVQDDGQDSEAHDDVDQPVLSEDEGSAQDAEAEGAKGVKAKSEDDDASVHSGRTVTSSDADSEDNNVQKPSLRNFRSASKEERATGLRIIAQVRAALPGMPSTSTSTGAEDKKCEELERKHRALCVLNNKLLRRALLEDGRLRTKIRWAEASVAALKARIPKAFAQRQGQGCGGPGGEASTPSQPASTPNTREHRYRTVRQLDGTFEAERVALDKVVQLLEARLTEPMKAVLDEDEEFFELMGEHKWLRHCCNVHIERALLEDDALLVRLPKARAEVVTLQERLASLPPIPPKVPRPPGAKRQHRGTKNVERQAERQAIRLAARAAAVDAVAASRPEPVNRVDHEGNTASDRAEEAIEAVLHTTPGETSTADTAPGVDTADSAPTAKPKRHKRDNTRRQARRQAAKELYAMGREDTKPEPEHTVP